MTPFRVAISGGSWRIIDSVIDSALCHRRSHLIWQGRAARAPADSEDDRAGHPYLEAWGWIKNLMRSRASISGPDDRLFSLVVNFGVRKAVSEIH